MKKIMILGAGIYQVPLIKCAKKLGLYTIVASIRGNYPGFSLADEVIYENTTDYKRILEIAKEKKIDGIVTAGTDVAVITIGKVCDELGLTGLTFKSAEIATNKLLMKERFEEYNVNTARFRKINIDEKNVSEKISSLQYPLICKAVDSSGSRGIVKINCESDIAGAVENVKSVTKEKYFLIEEYIEGDEFGAQAFVENKEVKFILPHGDFVFKGDTGVPVGHWVPFQLSDDIMEDIESQLSNAIAAMGLDNCAVNADFILSDNKVYVLEIGGRSGATCLAESVSIYYGYDYYEKIIRRALGEEVEFPDSCHIPNASKLLISDKQGRILEQGNYNSPDNSKIKEVRFDYKEGDSVRKFHVGPDRIGHVIAVGDSVADAIEELDNAIKNIKVIIQ